MKTFADFPISQPTPDQLNILNNEIALKNNQRHSVDLDFASITIRIRVLSMKL
jgi:hypothetical protein